MGLKILHSADWHLDSPFAGFSEEQRRLLKEEQRKIPGKVADLCCRENCDMVLLAGDIFDGEASRETIDILKDALAGCGVPVLVAPGNHDTGLLEDFQAEGDEKYCVAVLHGDPAQKNSPYNPITNAQVRNSGLDYLALGHIHKAGAFHSGNTLCAWPGCPMGRGWDETGEKGVCIVTLSDEAEIRAVSLDTLRFHDLEVDIGSDAVLALESVLPGVGSKDFYRVSLTGCGEVDLAALKQKFADFPNLELRDKTEPPIDIWGDTDEDTLEGVYFTMLRSAMEEDPENAHRIQLAAEISRKLLSGREVTL